jgi:hypothetical protein
VVITTTRRTESGFFFKAATWFLATAFLLAPALSQETNSSTQDAFSAVAMGTGGAAAARSAHFDVRITRYTTDDEIKQLAQLLKDKGQDALRQALEKLTAGRVVPVGSTGNDIAVARKRQVGKDTLITIVTARNMPFIELWRGGRTKDYPFGFLQLKLNEKGEGDGQIMVAAKIRFDQKKGNYEIESYGNQYIKAVNVQPLK